MDKKLKEQVSVIHGLWPNWKCSWRSLNLWGFHGGDCSECGTEGCDITYIWRWLPACQKMCCMSTGSKWSVEHWRQRQHTPPKCWYPLQGHTVSQPSRPRSEHFRMYCTFATYLILVLISTLLCGDKYKWWNSTLHDFFPCPLVIQIVLGLNTLCSTLFWSSYACLSYRVQNSFSHLYETTDGIISLYILMLGFQTGDWQTEDSDSSSCSGSFMCSISVSIALFTAQ